jgi:translation initiation factor IF-2
MDERDLRTRVAIQALDFSNAFKSVVGHVRLPPAGYVPELMPPEGPSTQGGQQARQRMRLVPTADKYPTLVVGSANVKSGRSELRSFEYVDAVHREHFGRPVELDRAAYEEFIALVKNYFAVAQMEVVIEDAPSSVADAPARPRISRFAVAFVAVAALSAAGVVAYYLAH